MDTDSLASFLTTHVQRGSGQTARAPSPSTEVLSYYAMKIVTDLHSIVSARTCNGIFRVTLHA